MLITTGGFQCKTRKRLQPGARATHQPHDADVEGGLERHADAGAPLPVNLPAARGKRPVVRQGRVVGGHSSRDDDARGGQPREDHRAVAGGVLGGLLLRNCHGNSGQSGYRR